VVTGCNVAGVWQSLVAIRANDDQSISFSLVALPYLLLSCGTLTISLSRLCPSGSVYSLLITLVPTSGQFVLEVEIYYDRSRVKLLAGYDCLADSVHGLMKTRLDEEGRCQSKDEEDVLARLIALGIYFCKAL
jgi:hypothetical protein